MGNDDDGEGEKLVKTILSGEVETGAAYNENWG